MAIARTVSPANGVTHLFPVSFPLPPQQGRAGVNVYVHPATDPHPGAPLPTSAFAWVSDGQINITVAPAAGNVVDIRRATLLTALDNTMQAGGSLRSAELVQNDTQLQYLVQECVDTDVDLQSQLDVESSTRATADTTEATARAAADAEETIARVNADTAEAATRSAADSTLNVAIANEATARVNADTVEANARTNADFLLSATISGETAARTNADTVLTGALAGETSSRVAADAGLGSRIDLETRARSTADAAVMAALINAGATISNLTIAAADRTILAGLSHTLGLPASLSEGHRKGTFDWYSTGDYLVAFGNTLAVDLALDPQQGVLVASVDGLGVWVRRENKPSPFHFGAVGKVEGQTTGWVDDAPALNAWATWITSRTNCRAVGDWTGKFVINSQVTVGSRTVSGRGIEIVGSCELFANAAMDRMLEIGRIDYLQISGQLHLFGGGPNTDGGDVPWANRLARIGCYNFGCSHVNADVLHGRFMQLAGYFTSASTGIESTDSSHISLARMHYCGSGVPGSADSLTANYSGPVNNGTGGTVGQSTTLTVDAIPPAWLTDLTGGNTNVIGGRALPVGAFVNGRVYQVTAVDATHINLYPWLDSTAPATGVITYIFGAGWLQRGSDSNVYQIDQLDVQLNGVGIWDLALYGPHISQAQLSSNGVAYMVNSGRADSNIGGGFESFYPEGNTADVVVFSDFATAVMWKNGNLGMYEGNLAKCYVALVPRNADNSFPPDQIMFSQLEMSYNGRRLVPQGHPGSNLYYGKATVDWFFGSPAQVFAGVGSTTVTLHPPGTNFAGGVRPNDDWAAFAEYNRLYGYDSAVAMFMGSAANGAPSGTITFASNNPSRAAVITGGSAVVTGLATTLGLVAGMFAQASGSVATTILSVDGPTQITLAAAAAVNATSIKVPATSVNGGATATFAGFFGLTTFAAYYRFSTNDIIIRRSN